MVGLFFVIFFRRQEIFHFRFQPFLQVFLLFVGNASYRNSACNTDNYPANHDCDKNGIKQDIENKVDIKRHNHADKHLDLLTNQSNDHAKEINKRKLQEGNKNPKQ